MLCHVCVCVWLCAWGSVCVGVCRLSKNMTNLLARHMAACQPSHNRVKIKLLYGIGLDRKRKSLR